jgi:DNA-binding transcriptional LysR family regulator
MHFEGLKIFCDVVRYNSFSRGALANGVSQSAASQAVLQLEKRMEVQLIDRSKRPWVLTPPGKFFFERSQDIVSRYLELEDAVRKRQASLGYIVRAAAIYSVGLQDMGQYVEKFKSEVPGADVELEYMHPDKVYQSVVEGKADMGLISFAQNGQELVTTPWRDEPMVFTCLPGHRLSRNNSIEPADLKGEPLVGFERGLAIRRAVDRFLKRRGVDVDVVAEFDNIATIKQAVEDGAGVSILPAPTLKREVDRGALVAAHFQGIPFVRPLSIIHRRKRLNSAVTGFMSLLSKANGVTPEAAEESTKKNLHVTRRRRRAAKGTQ